MTLHHHDDAVTLLHGDCIELMAAMPDNSVDAIVTDPPYGLGFMGKGWDDLPPGEPWARECLRVLKPGGHLLAFGGTRTWHRLACAIEDAGFEMRDSIAWLYGSGFPKGTRVNRDERFCQCGASAHTSSRTSLVPLPDDHTHTEDAAVAAEGAVRSVRRATHEAQGSPADCRPECGCDDAPPRPGQAGDRSSTPSPGCARGRSRSAERVDGPADGSSRNPFPAPRSGHPSSPGSPLPSPSDPAGSVRTLSSTSPAGTSESADRTPGNPLDPSSSYGTGFPLCTACDRPNADGWNVALKPAHEPIVVARKPLIGTVAQNVLAHGTGALNVDATRISAGQDYLDKCASVVGIDSNRNGDAYGEWTGTREDSSSPAGRWPANVVLDESQAAELDRQSGTLTSGRLDRAGIKADNGIYGKAPESRVGVYEQDSGGASRFFYVPQEDTCSVASLDTAGTTAASTPTGTAPAAEPPVPLDALGSRFRYQAKAPTKERPSYVGDDGNKISHATVKPLTLMRWLVRLVTPPGGTVLEPFAGSGTTIEAAVLEGFRCVAIEREADYLPLIMARLDRADGAVPDLGPTVDEKIAEHAAQVDGQLTIDEASA